MTLADLRKQKEELMHRQAELDKQIKAKEEEELIRLQNENWETIEQMSDEEKEYILSRIEHERSSCSAQYSENGWSESRHKFYCKKCMLEEIFRGEHYGRFRFTLDVVIEEVKA